MDDFRVSDVSDKISVRWCKLDFGPVQLHKNSLKIQKVSSLVCGFFFILISCANIFLIPIDSSASWSSMSVLDQYSHANRYMSCHQQFFCTVTFCFEIIHCIIQEILIYLLTACNNYSTCFYMN